MYPTKGIGTISSSEEYGCYDFTPKLQLTAKFKNMILSYGPLLHICKRYKCFNAFLQVSISNIHRECVYVCLQSRNGQRRLSAVFQTNRFGIVWSLLSFGGSSVSFQNFAAFEVRNTSCAIYL